MANLGNVFTKSEQELKKTQAHPKRSIQWIHYSKLIRSAYQKYSEAPEEVSALAGVIRVDGEVLQPVLTRKIDVEEYEVIAGHKRTLACKELVEKENLTQFEFLPCIVTNVSDVRARFQVMTSNHHHEKTPYEIMVEIEDMKYLLETYPEEFPDVAGRGRMVEKLAKQMKLSRSVVSDYRNIANNLSEKGKEALKEEQIDKSAAVALAGLPEEEQNELLEEGITTHSQIKQYKKEKKQEEEHSQKESVQMCRNSAQEPEACYEPESVENTDYETPEEVVEEELFENVAEVTEKSDMRLLQEQLDVAEKFLKDMQDAGFDESEIIVRKQKILVTALTLLKKNSTEWVSGENDV